MNALQARLPMAIVAFDLLGIGGRQIITANTESNNISIFATLGNFGHFVTYPAGVWPRALAVGEFN